MPDPKPARVLPVGSYMLRSPCLAHDGTVVNAPDIPREVKDEARELAEAIKRKLEVARQRER
jgi:hypothetical protein